MFYCILERILFETLTTDDMAPVQALGRHNFNTYAECKSLPRCRIRNSTATWTIVLAILAILGFLSTFLGMLSSWSFLEAKNNNTFVEMHTDESLFFSISEQVEAREIMTASEFIVQHENSATGRKGGFSSETKRLTNDATSAPVWRAQLKNDISRIPLRFEMGKFSWPSSPNSEELWDKDRLRIDLGLPVCTSSKWMVVTTTSPHITPVMHQFGLKVPENWCMVVVGDLRTPQSLEVELMKKYPHVIFLSVTRQKQLPYASASDEVANWNHIARKNLGYLYAMHQGAVEIYDTDDDNELSDDDYVATFVIQPQDFMVKEPTTMSSLVYNPYAEFRLEASTNRRESEAHPSKAWPRGLPLRSIAKVSTAWIPNSFADDTKLSLLKLVETIFNASSKVGKKTAKIPPHSSRIAVLQVIANGDPDVDAIYRLTGSTPLYSNVPRETTRLLPKGLFSPFNSQSTLWKKEAFANMFLCAHLHGRVTDIWRSYIAQRVMWDSDHYLAFAGPSVIHARDHRDHMGDFLAEGYMYERSEELIRTLSFMNLDDKNSLPQVTDSQISVNTQLYVSRLEKLYLKLHEVDLFSRKGVAQAQAWLYDLIRIGYEFPTLQMHAIQPTAEQVDQEQASLTKGERDGSDNFGITSLLKLYHGSMLYKALQLGARSDKLRLGGESGKIVILISGEVALFNQAFVKYLKDHVLIHMKENAIQIHIHMVNSLSLHETVAFNREMLSSKISEDSRDEVIKACETFLSQPNEFLCTVQSSLSENFDQTSVFVKDKHLQRLYLQNQAYQSFKIASELEEDAKEYTHFVILDPSVRLNVQFPVIEEQNFGTVASPRVLYGQQVTCSESNSRLPEFVSDPGLVVIGPIELAEAYFTRIQYIGVIPTSDNQTTLEAAHKAFEILSRGNLVSLQQLQAHPYVPEQGENSCSSSKAQSRSLLAFDVILGVLAMCSLGYLVYRSVENRDYQQVQSGNQAESTYPKDFDDNDILDESSLHVS